MVRLWSTMDSKSVNTRLAFSASLRQSTNQEYWRIILTGAIIGITGIFPLLEYNNDPRHLVIPDSLHRNLRAYSPTAMISLRGCFCMSFQFSTLCSKGSLTMSSLFPGACLV